MNTTKVEYNLDTHSICMKITIEASPRTGIDHNGIYSRATWSDCLKAIAILLEAIETDRELMANAIEGEVNGNVDTDEDDTAEED